MPVLVTGSVLSLFVLTLLLAAAYFTITLDIVFFGHDLSTTRKAARGVADILQQHQKERSTLYDLGSCRGDFIIRLVKNCPQLKAVGVEKSSLRIWISRVKAALLGRSAKFVRNDLFSANVSQADVIYAYLGTWDMPALEAKLQKESKPGAMIITNTQFFPHWQPKQVVVTRPNKPDYEKLFVYIKA